MKNNFHLEVSHALNTLKFTKNKSNQNTTKHHKTIEDVPEKSTAIIYNSPR